MAHLVGSTSVRGLFKSKRPDFMSITGRKLVCCNHDFFDCRWHCTSKSDLHHLDEMMTQTITIDLHFSMPIPSPPLHFFAVAVELSTTTMTAAADAAALAAAAAGASAFPFHV